MDKMMSLIVVKETQHVVAALTCNAKAELTAEAVVGPGLLLRGFLDSTSAPIEAQFQFPADKLEVVSVEYDSAVVLHPRDFVVKEVDKKKEVKQPGPINVTLQAFDATSATVELDDKVDELTSVFLHIDGGALPSPRSFTGTIDKEADETMIQFDQPLSNGDYSVMTLVTGSSAIVEVKTIP